MVVMLEREMLIFDEILLRNVKRFIDLGEILPSKLSKSHQTQSLGHKEIWEITKSQSLDAVYYLCFP